jgi:TENA/THI-4/PQQC family
MFNLLEKCVNLCPARGRGNLETSVVTGDRRMTSSVLAIRNHPFVQGVEQGTVPLAILRQFAHAEYWYMRGGVKHFALMKRTIIRNPSKSDWW